MESRSGRKLSCLGCTGSVDSREIRIVTHAHPETSYTVKALTREQNRHLCAHHSPPSSFNSVKMFSAFLFFPQP